MKRTTSREHLFFRSQEYVVEGELHLNTDDLSDLDAFHGRLVATISRGGTRRDIEAMEF